MRLIIALFVSHEIATFRKSDRPSHIFFESVRHSSPARSHKTYIPKDGGGTAATQRRRSFEDGGNSTTAGPTTPSQQVPRAPVRFGGGDCVRHLGRVARPDELVQFGKNNSPRLDGPEPSPPA